MKKIKTYLSLALVLAVLCTMAAMNVQVLAAQDDNTKRDLLVELGFFAQMPLRSDLPVTKGEFLTAIMRAIPEEKKVTYSGQDTGYSDVSSTNAYAGVVYQAKQYGALTNLSGNLNIDSNLNFRDATEIMLNVLGYRDFILLGGYASAMSSSGLNKCNAQDPQAVTQREVESFLYQLLDAKMLIRTGYGDENEYEIYDDRTFLSEVLDVYTGRGVVEDNSYTSLTGDSSLNQGNVKIGGLVFTMDFAKAKDLLGYSVEYYYRDTNDMDMPSLIWAQKLSSNQEVTVNYDQNITYSNWTYRYTREDSARESRINVARDANFIYNGKAIEAPFSQYVPENGTVTAIDNDGDGSYDVIKIYDYTIVVVGDIIRSTYEVTDLYGRTEVFCFDESGGVQADIVDLDGNFVDFFALKKWDILSVAKSQDGSVLYGVVSHRSVSGRVEGVEEDAIYIDGIRYETNPQRVGNQAGVQTQIVPNDVATFYMDQFGVIQAADKSMEAGRVAGYLSKALVEGVLENNLQLKIFTEQNDFVIYQCAAQVEIDGVVYKTPQSAYDKLLREDGTVEQLILYKINQAGEVYSIDTAEPFTESLVIPNGFREDVKAKSELNHYEDCFVNKVRSVDGVTKIFVVPEDRDSESMYYYTNGSYFAYNRTYTISAYSVEDKVPYSQYIVVYLGGGEQNFESYEMDLLIVQKVTNVMTEEGMPTVTIIRYAGLYFGHLRGKPGYDGRDHDLSRGRYHPYPQGSERPD